MKTVYIGFSRHRGNAIGSELIRKYMGTDFSHTYFKIKEDMYKDHTIFHAVGKGISYISEENLIKFNIPVAEFHIDISDETYKELMQDCHSNCGIKYGYFQNLGILIVDGLNHIGCSIKKNPFNDGINCSEWAAYLLQEMYGEWTDKDYNLVTPLDVYNYLKLIDSKDI